MEERMTSRQSAMNTEKSPERVSRNQLVRDRLRTEILEQRHLSREPLRISEIAERMHVSATPVREALLQLVGEGLVEFEHQKGFIVKTRSVRSTFELYELCEVIIMNRLSVMANSKNFGLTIQGDFLNGSLRGGHAINGIEHFYLELFRPGVDDESLFLMERILASTRIVRREILEGLSDTAPLFALYRAAHKALVEERYSQSIICLQAAFQEKRKYIEGAMVTLITRHLL